MIKFRAYELVKLIVRLIQRVQHFTCAYYLTAA